MVAKVWKSREAAAVALAGIEGGCLLVAEVFAFACEFAITEAATAGEFVIEWAFMKAANELIGKSACVLMGFCAPVAGMLPANATSLAS